MTSRRRTEATQRPQALSRAILLVVLTLVGLGSVPVASAATTPVRATSGVLAATTQITWSGKAGIALTVPSATSLRAEDMALHVTRGNYAYVRAFGRPKGCRGITEPFPSKAYCADYTASVDYLKAWSDGVRDPNAAPDPADGAQVLTADPPQLQVGALDLYLFTDGEATLTLTSARGSGRRAYRAAAPVSGPGVVTLPLICGNPLCGSPLPSAVFDERRAERVFTPGTSAYLSASAYMIVTSEDPTRQTLGLNRDQVGSLNVCLRYSGTDSECDPLDTPTEQNPSEDAMLTLNTGRQLGLWKTLYENTAAVKMPVGCVIVTAVSVESIARGCNVVTFTYGLSPSKNVPAPRSSTPPPNKTGHRPTGLNLGGPMLPSTGSPRLLFEMGMTCLAGAGLVGRSLRRPGGRG